MIWCSFHFSLLLVWKGSKLYLKLLRIGSSCLIWHFSCGLFFLLFYCCCFFLSLLFSVQPSLEKQNVGAMQIPPKIYSSYFFISGICWHLFFPVSIQRLSNLLFLFSESTNNFFSKRPFNNASLCCPSSSLNLSLAAGNLTYLSTGRTETDGFSLSIHVLELSLGTPSWEKKWWRRQLRRFTLKYRSSKQQLWPLNETQA